MAIKGSLKEASLPDVLQLLALGQKTGCLSIADRSNFGYIYFDKGRICYASIVNRRDRLGDILVKHEKITSEHLDAAIHRQSKEHGKKLGEILVGMGVITQADLERYMRVQIEESVFYLFTWTQGTFNFEADIRPERQDFLVSINPESLLLEGARRVDEWSLIEKKIPSFDLIFVVDKDRLAISEGKLTDTQERILPLLDGSRGVNQVIEDAGLGEFEIGKALYGLITAGFVHRAGRTASAVDAQVTDARVEEHRNLGIAFYKTGMLDEAAREFRRVAELRPGEPHVKVRIGLAGPQFGHAPELARRFVQHAGLVEGDPEIAVLLDARVGDLRVDGRRGAARAVHEPRRDQPVQRLADLELAEPRVFDHLVHAARAVEQGQDPLLGVGELPLADREPILVHDEDQVERRNLFLDQAPLVDAPRPLEQQRLRVDRDEEILALGADVRLEVERPLGPGEQVEHRLLDLHPHVALEVRLRDHPHADQDLTELFAVLLALPVDGRVEMLRGDLLVLHEDVAQAVAPIHDRRVADAALVEVDVAEVRAVGDGETPRLLPERQELQHVGKRGLLERALDGHQRNSSITRSVGSVQSHTIFSRLLIPPRLETTRPLVRRPALRRASRGAWPSSTSRASPALTGASCAAAALTTRWTPATRPRTESACRSAR